MTRLAAYGGAALRVGRGRTLALLASRRGVRAPAALHRAGFRQLWLGFGLSVLGAQVGGVALPLVAIVALGASPAELGVLGAARWLPYLLVGLLAGVVLDRTSRRRVLIVSHLGRAVLLGSIPVAASLGGLRIEHLVLVAFGVGGLMIFSDAAYQSVVPQLVEPAELVEANASLEASRSVAQVVGPGLGGLLVQLLGAPLAVLGDALAFGLDALLVWRIRLREPDASSTVGEALLGGRWPSVREGLVWVFGHRLLRPMQLASMTFIGANAVWSTVYLLFLTRQLGLAPWQVGLLLGAGGPGALLGALVSDRTVAAHGLGRPIVAAHALAAVAIVTVPLGAALPLAWAPALLAAAAFGAGLGITLSSICELSLRQRVTPRALHGRMNATMRSLNWSMAAVGALVGGTLGEQLGIVPTLIVGTLGAVLSCGWLIWSPLAHPAVPECGPAAAL